MTDAPPALARKPCCVCDGPGGQHCTKCKARHYCGKACQLAEACRRTTPRRLRLYTRAAAEYELRAEAEGYAKAAAAAITLLEARRLAGRPA
ncbi:hypothetical protein M885DRAFT_558660 [Pelagophyceae sp. CCMP2097]|nr:hypothetical protein M885DRAFT_558660 [Pelagophyceae sp. CCMP2097]